MAERHDSFGEESSPGGGQGDDPYAWISEWLCEYVDGTMDPSMQGVFEEYLKANPDLADHVERLCRTRALLGDCGCDEDAVERAKSRLHGVKERAHEAPLPKEAPGQDTPARVLAEEASSDELTSPLNGRTVAAVASAMTLMLGVGMFAGAAFFADRAAEGGVPTASSSAVERPTAEGAQPAPDRSAVPPQRTLETRAALQLQGEMGSRAAFTLQRAPSFRAHPPLPLKKMPTGIEDSAGASGALMQTTGLNR